MNAMMQDDNAKVKIWFKFYSIKLGLLNGSSRHRRWVWSCEGRSRSLLKGSCRMLGIRRWRRGCSALPLSWTRWRRRPIRGQTCPYSVYWHGLRTLRPSRVATSLGSRTGGASGAYSVAGQAVLDRGIPNRLGQQDEEEPTAS